MSDYKKLLKETKELGLKLQRLSYDEIYGKGDSDLFRSVRREYEKLHDELWSNHRYVGEVKQYLEGDGKTMSGYCDNCECGYSYYSLEKEFCRDCRI